MILSRYSVFSGAFAALTVAGLMYPTGTIYADADPVAPAAVSQTSSTASTLPDYRLNVRDRVRIQVFEWRPSMDEVYTWTALNQIYTIDPAGNISLPLVGSISAVGYTTSELELMISRQLAKRLKLATLPDTSIEVTEFRPIYVTGAVEKSGEYSYTSGMSVLQGVSLAGGLFKNASASGLRLEREWVTTAGSYQSLVRERERLIARKSRLEAELASADRIAFPAELQSVSEPEAIEFAASVMSNEQHVFELRKKANDTQLVALDQLQGTLEAEVASLDKRVGSQQTQIDLLNSELKGIKSLTDKGLATQPRLLGLKRNVAELEGQKLMVESDKTRAMQEVSRNKLAKIEYQNKRENDLTVELQTTEARLQQIKQEVAVDQRLLAETKSQAVASPLRLTAAMNGEELGNATPKIHYTISRQVGGGTIEIEATENTALQPGDTVKVEVTMPPASATGSDDDMDAFFRGAPPTKKSVPVDNSGTFRNAIPSPTRASISGPALHTLEP
jgi:protein involved in polysaccharide export with SLBB domain